MIERTSRQIYKKYLPELTVQWHINILSELYDNQKSRYQCYASEWVAHIRRIAAIKNGHVTSNIYMKNIRFNIISIAKIRKKHFINFPTFGVACNIPMIFSAKSSFP